MRQQPVERLPCQQRPGNNRQSDQTGGDQHPSLHSLYVHGHLLLGLPVSMANRCQNVSRLSRNVLARARPIKSDNDFQTPLLYQMQQLKSGSRGSLLTNFPFLHR